MVTMSGAQIAKYQLTPNSFVLCYLDIIEARASGFKIRAGIRAHGDAIIPVGTKLYLVQPNSTPALQQQTQFELFYVVAEGVEVIKGATVQTCSPIHRETRPNQRQNTRQEATFRVKFAEISDGQFTVLNGNLEGLTLNYQSSKLFLGLVLGQTYTLKMLYQGQALTIPVGLVHLHYDWYHNQHKLGVGIRSLTPEARSALTDIFMAPAQTPRVKALVDTEQVRIRQNTPDPPAPSR